MLASLAEIDAARAKARSLVHRRALKAAAKAAEPLGIAGFVWRDALDDLIADVQAIFELTPEQKTELQPAMLTSLASLATAYAPPVIKAEAIVALGAGLVANPIARFAAKRAGRRLGRRAIERLAFGRIAFLAVARRAWVIPVALGGATGATYELLGRRCINQCHAFLRARLAPILAVA